MVAHIFNYPLASPIVSLSMVTELTDGRISKIIIDLTSRIVLTPDSVTYFKTNNLLPEALSKAGLDEDITYSVIQQTSYVPSGDYHYYRLQLTIPTS